MKSLLLMFLCIAILGYLAGATGRKLQSQNSATMDESTNSSGGRRGKPGNSGVPSTITSEDTVATLAGTPAAHLYDRLALWLLDASASDMQEFWLEYSKRTDRTNDLNDLVFINWTRVDPEAAIVAAEGTEFARYPWWAWACHEPEKALEEVLARYGGVGQHDHIGEVMWGIGEFHPSWLREHIDELPEKWMKDRALMGYSKWADTENPRESLEFLKARGWNINPKTITALGREDPVAAYQLAVELKGDDSNYRYQQLPDQLIDSLAAEDPALLDQILARTKSPQGKMKIQLKQFEELLKIDLAAAEEKAQQLPKSWAREDHLSALGKHYLKTDPEKALEITTRLLKEKVSLQGRMTWIYQENGGSGSGAGESPVALLVQQLAASHGKELIESALPTEGNSGGPYRDVGAHWARQDLPGFAEWVNQQDDPEIYRSGASTVISRLSEEAHYSEAMDWSRSLLEENSKAIPYQVRNTYQNWYQSSPAEAHAWKESAQLGEHQLQQFEQIEKGSQ